MSNRHTLIARSGLPNSRIRTGVILASKSSFDSFVAIFITTPKALGPPPPNSTDFNNSGRIFILKKSSGKSSVSCSRSLTHPSAHITATTRQKSNTYSRKASRSSSLLTPRFSMPSVSLISGLSKKALARRPWSRKWATLRRALGLALAKRL